MNGLWNDVKFGLRMLAKSPGFTAVALLSLALGMGANTAVFSVIYSALFESLPYPHPERIVEVFETAPDGNYNSVAGGAFKDWYEYNTKFDRLAVFEGSEQNLTGNGVPERVSGLLVSSEFLSVLGIRPTIGRDFATGEDRVGGNNRVVILSHQFWMNRYEGDKDIISKTVVLDQIPYTVIGVLPPIALMQDDAMFLTPDVIDANPSNWQRAGHWRRVIGRVKPGVDPMEAQTELQDVKRRLTAEYPAFKKDWSVAVVSMKEFFFYMGNVRPILAILLGTVALVLLIACTNVASLLLARENVRARELAIRSALGARSWQIVRQILIESLLLAFAGCVVGVLLAIVSLKLLSGFLAHMLPQMLQPHLDVNILAFSAIIACSSGFLFGIFPAIVAGKLNLNRDLKETERGIASVSRRRIQSIFVVSEYALTIVLLIGTCLFLRSFIHLLDIDPGFNPNQTMAFDLTFPQAKYPANEDRLRFIKDLNNRIDVLPGVKYSGAVFSLPLSMRGRTEQVCRADLPPRTDYVVGCNYVSGDYFPAVGARLVRGRILTEEDNTPDASRAFVIDQGIARDLYPDEDPIGQSLRFLGESWKIVGIVESVHHFSLDKNPRPMVYLSQARSPIPTDSESVIIRTSLPLKTIAPAVRETVHQVDSDLPIANLRTLEQDIQNALLLKRAVLILLGLFAVIAIVLACIGVYGVTMYAVSQRTIEIGVRIALGAQSGNVVSMILKHSMKLACYGIVCGVTGAFVLNRFLQSMLYNVSATDLITFFIAPFFLTVIALLACYIPARRAAKVDPMVALRYE